MNYYRRYVGDFQADTMALSLLEQGIYDRLLDHMYASEMPIPPGLDRAAIICRTSNAKERAAVKVVLSQYFEERDDGWHHRRVEKEIALARARTETAKESGKKGAEARWGDHPPDSKGDGKRHSKSHGKPDGKTHGAKMPLHPPSTNQVPLSDNRFPGDGDTSPPERTADGAQPQVNTDALARIVAECERAKVQDAGPESAVIARWMRNGATPTHVINACAEARKTMHFPKPLPIGYVDKILEAMVDADRRARANAEARHAGTKAQLAEQSGWTGSPMPDNLKPRKAASA